MSDKKNWTVSFGKPVQNPGDPDALLQSKLSERKRKELERQDEIDGLKHEATKADLEKKIQKSNPDSGESPFKLKGEVDIGRIDLQEQQRQMKEDSEKERAGQAQTIEQLRKDNDVLKEALHTQQMEALRTEFALHMDDLKKSIESGKLSQKSFTEQFEELEGMAKKLGLSKTAEGRDPMVELKLAEMDYDRAKEEREFKWRMRQDQKQFEITLRKMDEEREFRHAELAQQAKKDDLFASFPQRLGSAIGKGILTGGVEEESEQVSHRVGGKSYHIEIGEGEAGEIECPNCHTAVGVGPTTKKAACVKCASQFAVVRKPSSAPPEEE